MSCRESTVLLLVCTGVSRGFIGLLINSGRGLSAPPWRHYTPLTACHCQAQAQLPQHQLKLDSISGTAYKRSPVPEEQSCGMQVCLQADHSCLHAYHQTRAKALTG